MVESLGSKGDFLQWEKLLRIGDRLRLPLPALAIQQVLSLHVIGSTGTTEAHRQEASLKRPTDKWATIALFAGLLWIYSSSIVDAECDPRGRRDLG